MANNSVQDTKSKAQDAAGKTADAARDLGHEAAQKAREIGHDLADAGRSAASAATKAVDNAASRTGEGISSLGDSVREYGPRQGMMGQATETVAQSFEKTGQYLKDEGFTGMTNDLTEMVKRNPLPALLFGIGVGFILARLTSSRS